MNIEIKGFQKNSLIDWEGKISTVIFLPGCNFACLFCHAVELVKSPEILETISLNDIKQYLAKTKNWVDGVVICGGEPTIHSEIKEFITQFKNMGLLVKLDTNGYRPDVLRELLKRNLLDYVAMDIKAPLPKYSIICGVKVEETRILESIEILKEGKIDYEFRTTVVPSFIQKDDIEEISKLLAGSRHYALQQFSSQKTLQPQLSETETYTKEELEKLAEIARRYIKSVSIRAA